MDNALSAELGEPDHRMWLVDPTECQENENPGEAGLREKSNLGA